MHTETEKMYLNTIKTVLGEEERFEIFKKKLAGKSISAREREELFIIGIYHKYGRDKQKVQKVFDILYLNKKQDNELLNHIEEAIGLHKRAIEKLEKIKEYVVLKGVEF